MGLHLTGSSLTQLNNAFAASLTATAVKTSAYTAAAGDLIPVDATSGAVTITLPTAPADRTRVAVKKIDASTNAVTVSRGGSSDVFNKSGGSTSLTLSLTNQALSLQYSGGIWYVVGDDLPLGQLDTRFGPAVGSDNWLKAWGSNIDSLIRATTITRDANEAATGANVIWPDGTAGVYTGTASSGFPGAVDSYTVTYVGGTTKTVTQPTMTRDTNGAVTTRPALTVA